MAYTKNTQDVYMGASFKFTRENCPCCETCKDCVGFQKILDLKNAGLVMYRTTNRIDEVNKTTRLLKNSVNTNDDIFIVHNTKDIQIKADECISEIDQGISCARCRELVQRAKKYLRNVPPIDKKDVISVCDHCQQNRIKKRSLHFCYKCHQVLKKYHADEIKQITANKQIKTWLSNVNKFENVITDKSTKKTLKCRSCSDFFLNNIYNSVVRTGRHLEVRPMLEKGVRMTDSVHSIDNETKEDSEYTKSKSVIIRADSVNKIESYFSSSVTTYDTPFVEKLPNKTEDLKPTTLQIIKGVLQRDSVFGHKIKTRPGKPPSTLRRYYSEEIFFFSAAGLTDYDMDENFSYVFPKGKIERVRSLRRVKTSAELILDTQKMLRQRATEEKNKFQSQRKVRTRKKIRSGEKSVKSSDDEDGKKHAKNKKGEESANTKMAKPKHESEKGKKAKIKEESEKNKKEKKSKYGKEKVQKEQKQEVEIESRSKDKADQIRKEKEDRLRLLEEKKAKQEQLKTEKEEKQREKQDQLRQEKEMKQRMKEEQQKLKEEKEKNDKLQIESKQKLLNIKKQQNDKQDVPKLEANRKTKEEAERKLKALEETKVEKKNGSEKTKFNKTQEEPTSKELNIKQVKMRMPSTDDLILQLVRLRQSIGNKDGERPKRLSEINVTPSMVTEHTKVHKGKKVLNCTMCLDSDLELDVENILNTKVKPEAMDIIVGNKIFKCKHPLREIIQTEEMIPILYNSICNEEIALAQDKERTENITKLKEDKLSPVSYKYGEQEVPKGIIRYALSDRSFIDKGWTMLPTEKVVRKMNVYRMRPAHSEFDWFDRNKNKRLMLYDTGEKLAEFDDNGRGRWFYRNGRIALDYYDAEEMNAQQRLVIYGSGEPDGHGRYQPVAILATFDYLGNGVVFDHTGKIRLKYNQTEGVVLDRNIGPVSHWKWHTLNDPPVLQQVMIDTQIAHKDPDILKLGLADDEGRSENEEMLAIEFDNFIKEKSKKLSQKFKPFQIRTKALKINDNFSLKVLDQANIYLIFRDGTTNIKMNIGMILDHQEIVDTDTAEVGEVSNNLERFPARTDSLAGLQRSVAYAQRVERLRVDRERRLRYPKPCSSVDKLVSAASRPLKPKLQTVPSSSTVAKDDCICNCRKRSTHNVYYDTRFV